MGNDDTVDRPGGPEGAQTPFGDSRRTPHSAARRKRAIDSNAQVEEWRLRQATRAVPPEYSQAGRSRIDRQRGEQVPSSDASASQGTGPDSKAATVAVQAVDSPDTAAVSASPATGAVGPATGIAAQVQASGASARERLPLAEAVTRAKAAAADAPARLADAARKVSGMAATADGGKRLRRAGVAAAVLVYLLAALFFTQHFYPGATIGSVEVGGLTVSQAAEALGKSAAGYELQVKGNGDFRFTVTAGEAGLTLDSNALARAAKDDEPGLLWPVRLFMPHDHSDVLVASADAGGFREKVADAVTWYNRDATAPLDASIAYDEKEGTFAIRNEEAGNMLDEDAVVRHVAEALGSMKSSLSLGEGDYLHPAVTADDPRLQEALKQAETALAVNVLFTAHGNTVASLTGATAAKWVTTDENVQMALDEDAVNTWVQELVDKSGTVGAKRAWTREDGVQCTVEGGVYGWEADWLAVDEALHTAIAQGSTESVEIPMQQQAAVYNGQHGRDWKAYIDVDLDAQHATYYSDAGAVLWEADFVSGAPDGEHDTPQGVYFINAKESPSVLVGEANATGSPEYRTEVQFWMPWRGNDVGFHDADWQDEFGGTRFEDGFGSHGCINLSPEDAAALYKIAAVDTVVVCHGAAAKEGN